jgi:hypothetical protein
MSPGGGNDWSEAKNLLIIYGYSHYERVRGGISTTSFGYGLGGFRQEDF